MTRILLLFPTLSLALLACTRAAENVVGDTEAGEGSDDAGTTSALTDRSFKNECTM